jgi:hypothetical protein
MNGESWSLLAKLGLTEVGCDGSIVAALSVSVHIALK